MAVTRLDGMERSNAYRRVASYPMYVIVGQATREFLDAWRESMVMTLVLAAMLLGWGLVRHTVGDAGAVAAARGHRPADTYWQGSGTGH